jgi:hypothetical protein
MTRAMCRLWESLVLVRMWNLYKTCGESAQLPLDKVRKKDKESRLTNSHSSKCDSSKWLQADEAKKLGLAMATWRPLYAHMYTDGSFVHLHLGSGGGLLQGSTHFDDSPCLPVAGELLHRCYTAATCAFRSRPSILAGCTAVLYVGGGWRLVSVGTVLVASLEAIGFAERTNSNAGGSADNNSVLSALLALSRSLVYRPDDDGGGGGNDGVLSTLLALSCSLARSAATAMPAAVLTTAHDDDDGGGADDGARR